MSANQTLAVTWMNAVLHGYVGYTSRIVRTTAKMHVNIYVNCFDAESTSKWRSAW